MSIRIKILAGLIVVFALILGAINFIMLGNYRTNDEQSISRDLGTIQNNGLFYTKQDLLINNDSIDSDSFAAEADSIVSDLGKTTNTFFAAYTLSGKLITSNGETVFKHLPDTDLKLATQGKAAYHIETAQGMTMVAFSFPVTINGQKIGILRCLNDYTSVFTQSDNSIRLINAITLAGLLLCLLFGAVMSRSVISPVRRLCTNLKKTAGAIQSDRLDTQTIRERLNLKRRDEIGDVTRSIVDLIDKISLQIAVINKDRAELSRISEYRKDFYNIVTHELKTPLTSIKGYAEVARDNGFNDKEFFDKAMTRIVEESDRLHEMVVTLLEESKLNSSVEMPLDRIDLTDAAKNVCDSMKYKADKYGRVIHTNLQGQSWVLGNLERLRELIINLVDNAIKYADQSGIDVGITQEAGYVKLEISNSIACTDVDENAGFLIPANGSQGAAHEKGSVGLGLNICRQIVEKHNGTIRFSVQSDRKLCVSVVLPVYRGL